MTTLEIQDLKSQRNFLQERLQETPPNARLTRMSTEARIRNIELRLAAARPDEREPARVQLTFRGKPVIGSHGVFADFGAKATNAFTELVDRVAASLTGPLASAGRIPNRDQSQLLITNTVPGSFGFELEEYREGVLPFCEDSSTAQAFELTQTLLQSTLESDDELADAVTATDPRAVAAARSFLEVLFKSEAVCALEFRGKLFRFRDVGAVRTSFARLAPDNLHVGEQKLAGEFMGVLPDSRRFEFKLASDGAVIRGKLGPDVTDAEELNRHLHQPVRVSAMVTRVGSGKPRYVLIQQPNWSASESGSGEPVEA